VAILAAAALLAACGKDETPAVSTAITSTLPPGSTSPSGSASAEPDCTTAQLKISWNGIPGGLSHAALVLLFENTGTRCALRGYPGIDGVDADGNVAAQARQTPSGYLGGPDTPGEPAAVDLAPGQTASALLEGSLGPLAGEPACPRYEALLVTPPGETRSVRLSTQSSLCYLEVHPLVTGATGDANAPGGGDSS
jgi:hypothetical protein